MSGRKMYKFTLTTSVQVDDEVLSEVKRLIQERINIMYHHMERIEDIRVVLQHSLEVIEQ